MSADRTRPADDQRPRVSVIVPVRNRRTLLRHTLDALAAQEGAPPYEVIVVDDGSTDGTGDEVVADARAGRPVQLVQGDGHGAVAARTAGVAVARGDVLAFTDSDCVPDAGWLAAGLRAIDGGAEVVQGLTRPPRAVRPLERAVWSTTDDGLYATCNVFYTRDAFDAAGGFDTTAGDRLGFRPGSRLTAYGFGEDTLLGWRVRRTGRAAFAPDAVVEHEVLPPDLGDAVRRAWTTGAFPALFREVPELADLMGDDLRTARRERLPLYIAGVSFVLGRRRLATASAGVWVGLRAARLRRSEPSMRRLVKVLPADLAVEAVRATALAIGSARARRALL